MTAFIIGVLLVLIVVAVLNVWYERDALKTHGVDVPLHPGRVATVVQKSFNNLLWEDVPGPGMINKRRRNPKNAGPTVSVDIEDGQGLTRVDTWMSMGTRTLGMVNQPSAAYRQKKKLLARVEAAAQVEAVGRG